MISFKEVSLHNKRDDCWVIIHGQVYNLTEFLNEHPGGSKVILKFKGLDATTEFEKFHPKDMMDRFLKKEYHLGRIDPATITADTTTDSIQTKATYQLPPLSSILNLYDFENVARVVLTPDAWAYYSSGGENELTLQENQAAFKRIWFKPRVLVNVKEVSTSTTIMGTKSSLPLYITATALGKLGHPEGEVVLTKAAGTKGIIQMIPTLASCSLDEMINAAVASQTQWFQLYVNADKKITRNLIERAQSKGVKALCITVDAPQLGRREKDMRVKFENDAPDVQGNRDMNRNQGAARAISGFIDPSLSWDDIPWLKSVSKVPIILKGIQCGEDAVLAAKAGVQGIVISNHGGRQLDTCRSAIECLKEVMDDLRTANLDGKMEIYIDGGIRRGSDIFKALALGATAVGLGRPFLYAMSSYGQAGVEQAIDILKEELEMTMRLMGVTSIDQINRKHILDENLSNRSTVIRDGLSESVYERMQVIPVSKL
ncbi:FMN-dependent dehydrogenase-domain-containing protein [Globomyces pollinis-pini]|nr:FMN-dependent dehydrogenase-domain-containing protein [Globomyces pollinis-pini]